MNTNRISENRQPGNDNVADEFDEHAPESTQLRGARRSLDREAQRHTGSQRKLLWQDRSPCDVRNVDRDEIASLQADGLTQCRDCVELRGSIPIAVTVRAAAVPATDDGAKCRRDQ